MDYDRFVGVNRKAEVVVWKIVGSVLAFFFTLFVSGLVKLF